MMKYLDGKELCLGDKVRVAGEPGTVVAVIDTNQYSEAYPGGWSYLKKGALIEASAFGLLHYDNPDEDLVFLSRSAASRHAGENPQL